jgi:DNA invertase Pin-like site-specific DNA recombinase
MAIKQAPAAAPTLFGYGRVSTTEQTTENQLHELRGAGFNIPARHWFADKGVSGGVPAMQRPEFGKLLGKLRQGDTLIVSKLDRLGRDMVDVVSMLRRLADEGVRVKVLALGDADLTSSAGKVIVGVLAAVAEMERDLLIERTQAGLARAKAEGKTLGRKPKTDEAQRAVIRERLGQGVTVSELSRDFKVSRATIISIRETAKAAV